jgi:hypothetical protein
VGVLLTGQKHPKTGSFEVIWGGGRRWAAGDLLKAPWKTVGGFQTPNLANGAGQLQNNSTLTLKCPRAFSGSGTPSSPHWSEHCSDDLCHTHCSSTSYRCLW